MVEREKQRERGREQREGIVNVSLSLAPNTNYHLAPSVITLLLDLSSVSATTESRGALVVVASVGNVVWGLPGVE